MTLFSIYYYCLYFIHEETQTQKSSNYTAEATNKSLQHPLWNHGKFNISVSSSVLCCHYESNSIIKAMFLSRNTNYCSLSHAIPPALRNLWRLSKSRTFCVHKLGRSGNLLSRERPLFDITLLFSQGWENGTLLSYKKAPCCEEQPGPCAPRSLSHRDHTREPAISEIKFWVWEVADREIDSKYICFHKSLLFSVLTAIKMTWN